MTYPDGYRIFQSNQLFRALTVFTTFQAFNGKCVVIFSPEPKDLILWFTWLMAHDQSTNNKIRMSRWLSGFNNNLVRLKLNDIRFLSKFEPINIRCRVHL